MRIGRFALGLVALFASALRTDALETDQFYAWTRPIADATDAVNAEINAGIGAALGRVNARKHRCSCLDAQKEIRKQFGFMIIARLELWAMKSSSVERVPADAAEEPVYRRGWLYGGGPSLDPIHWMPPSPTIEIAGVRIGTDKLGHFLSDGAFAEMWYRGAKRRGDSDDEALAKAMRLSVITERTIWGQSSSGILSRGDLEANYEGLVFYRGLCTGGEPGLVRAPDGWRLRRPFDFRDFVSPEWDESWQPNVLSPSRWKKVRPAMQRYCGLLNDPVVRARRNAYAERDRQTPMEEIVRKLVAAGKLADPSQFTIESACSLPATGGARDSSR